MTQSATSIYRFAGELTVGSGLGYTARGQAVLWVGISLRRIFVYTEARGITPVACIAGGVSVRCRAHLLEMKNATFARLFPGYVSSTTVSLQPATIVPGTRLDRTQNSSMTFTSSPSGLSITADRVVTGISEDPVYIGIEQDNTMVIEVDPVFNDGDTNFFTITLS